MAQPQSYNREVDFTERDGDDTNHAGINAELDAAALSINQIRDNLALIQRDDGGLQNGIVGAEQLAQSAFDAIKTDINEAVQDAQQAAESATLAASTAITARDDAQTAETNAETAAAAALLNANTATTKAAEASASATSAAASALASANSATASQTARLASEAARDAAQAAQTAAAASQTAAATSATSAATSATNAATSASTATTQAGIATTQATNAATSATAAAASFADFNDRYLGAKSTAPTVDNDGNPLQVGTLYYDTTLDQMRVYTPTGWGSASSSVNGTSARFRYIATAGQTTFTGTDSNGNTLAYDAGFVDVYLNGQRLDQTDYTASSGTSIVLGSAAAVGDELNIVAFGTFVVANLNAGQVAAADGSGGSLFTTVAGFITRLMSSAGSALVGFIQAGTGAVARFIQDRLRETVSVKDFGAVGDEITDDTSAIQAAINHVQGTNGTLYFPPGVYIVTGAGLTVSGPINIVGAGNNASSIKNTNGRCLNVSGIHVYVSNIAFNSWGGGHTITQPSGSSLSQSSFVNVIIIQQGVTYSCWDNNGQEFLNNRFRDCEFYHGTIGAPASVPAFKLVSAGGDINDNVWETTRVNGNNSNGYFFHIEATGVNYQYNNTFRDITFEICNGGGIRLISCFAYEIINCTNWDAELYGPVRNHFYDIKSNANNYLSQGVIKHCYRWAGVNNAGIYDIKLGAYCNGTVIENCGAGNYANAFIADLGNNNCVVLFPDLPTFVLLNSSNAIVLNDGGYIRAGKGVKGVLPVMPETYTFGSVNVPAARIVGNASGGTATLPTSLGALQWANAAGSTVYGAIDVLLDNPSASGRTGMVLSCVINGTFAEGVRIQATDGAFLPGADNARPLGNASKRWSTVYAGTGTINTSDAREKQQVRELSAKEKAVATRLKSLIKAFKFNDAVQLKGDGARIHFGVIAQDVKAAFEAEGLVAESYAILCYDEWLAKPEVKDEKGNVVQAAALAGNRYGVRYEELLAFIISAM